MGLLVVLIGAAFIAKAISTLSKESLAPKRTLHTLQELKGGESKPEPKQHETESGPTSQQLEAQVEATEAQMAETFEELGERLSPRYLNAQLKQQIQTRPYRVGLYAVLAGFLSGLILKRRFTHA